MMPLNCTDIISIIDSSIEENLTNERLPINRVKYDVACLYKYKFVLYAESLQLDFFGSEGDETCISICMLDFDSLVKDAEREIKGRGNWGAFEISANFKLVKSIKEGASYAEP